MALSHLASRPGRWKPLLLCALLLALLCASLAWQGVAWLRLLRSPPPTVAASAQAPSSSLVTVARLAPLFGPPPSARAAPATHLRLTLQGSFVNEDPRRSSAIVQPEGGKPGHFLIGQELESGVRLHAVHSDRVEIERNGGLETLRFPSQGKASAAAGTDVPADSRAPVELGELPDEDLDQLRERLSHLRQHLEAETVEETPGQAEPAE